MGTINGCKRKPKALSCYQHPHVPNVVKQIAVNRWQEGEEDILQSLEKAVGCAQLAGRDEHCDHWPKCANDDRVGESEHCHWNIRVDKGNRHHDECRARDH